VRARLYYMRTGVNVDTMHASRDPAQTRIREDHSQQSFRKVLRSCYAATF